MVNKSFDITVDFEEADGLWLPIVKTVFILPSNYAFRVPLLLDTGADGLVLHPKYQGLFPNRVPEQYKTMGSEEEVEGTKTTGQIELFGRTIYCEIGFVEFEYQPYKAGLLGRECLMTFGIGFWESARQFYVTLTP